MPCARVWFSLRPVPGDVSTKSEQRVRWALQLLFAAFLLWLYAGDLLRYVRAQSASLAVLHALPSLPLSLAGTAVALAYAVTLVLARNRPAGWRPRRLANIAAVLLIFIDFLVLASRRTGELPELELVGALGDMTQAINNAATLDGVPTDARAFEKDLTQLGPPPLFVGGERLAKWSLEVRRNCTGPADKPGAPGTFIYCVAPDATHGWVTLTATAGAATFGDPAIIATQGPWVGEVSVAQPHPEAPPEDPVWQPPTQDEAP